jgi:hypothetical protein
MACIVVYQRVPVERCVQLSRPARTRPGDRGFGPGISRLMTDIDTAADIDIVWREREVTVSIPLAGDVPAGWCRRYDELARRQGLAAQAQQHPGRTWVVVTLPAATGRSDMVATMDLARNLIAKADATEEAPDAEETAAVIREWWAGQRG